MSLPWPPERTIVQEQEQGDPRFDLRTDAVAVYGVNATFSARLAWWRERGYRVHLMTGLAWGEYQDYLLGRWDGQVHWDEAQHRANGTPQQHGEDTPYMVPTEGYARYLAGLLHRAIDEGVEVTPGSNAGCSLPVPISAKVNAQTPRKSIVRRSAGDEMPAGM